MTTARRSLALLAAAALGACVPYPGLAPDGGAPPTPASSFGAVSGAFPGLDAGAADQQSLHFETRAYGADVASAVSASAERDYQSIMTDTGLYSFQPKGLYQIVVYGTQDEYRKKTGQPEWSAGVCVGNAIYTYASPRLEGVLAHEMTHLIWFEFMGGRLTPQQRWVNEGLAVYEESKASNRGQELFSALLPGLRANPLPMDQIENLAPNTERAYDASVWYAQAESMVRFLIERGGRIGFAQFLTALRDGQTFDAAVAAGFPGQWTTLAAYYSDWKRSLS
jgi:hypothetical protein